MRRSVVSAVAALSALSAVGFVPTADAADGVPSVVAAPGGSRGAGYATRVTAVQPGDRPLLVNLDVQWHNLVAEDFGPDSLPWCLPVDPSKPENPVSNPRRYPVGECPLFRADFATAPAGRSVVEGLDAVESGKVYAFRCEVVEGMTGNFFVL